VGIRDEFDGDASQPEGGARLHRQFSESNFSEDLTRIDVPTPHPWRRRPDRPHRRLRPSAARAVPGAQLKVYPRASHYLSQPTPTVNADLLDFISRDGDHPDNV
jgi:hypothetical protein